MSWYCYDDLAFANLIMEWQKIETYGEGVLQVVAETVLEMGGGATEEGNGEQWD